MIGQAIANLAPNAKWRLEGEDYSKIEWFSADLEQPSIEAIEGEVARLKIEADNNAHQYKRAREYPPITDYLDGIVKGDQAQIDKYIADCQAVKAKYPKGA